MTQVGGKHRRTLEQIFARPTSGTIHWDAIERLLIHLGAHITEGNGSRIRIQLNGLRASFHRPHPEPTADEGAVNDVRKLLENAGIRPPS